MAEAGKNWYVMRAVSGKEAKLKEYIEAELKHNQLLADHVYVAVSVWRMRRFLCRVTCLCRPI